MFHLFYEEANNNAYSSLVAWTPTGQIILPKRYYAFKHFTNLVKKDYSLITSSTTSTNHLFTGAFISEDETKIVLQVFNEGNEKNISIDIPRGAISVERILTTNNDTEEFTSLGIEEINYYDRYFTTNLPELSLTSYVFNIEESLSDSSNYLANNNLLEVGIYPNPSEDEISLIFTEYSKYSINIFDLGIN